MIRVDDRAEYLAALETASVQNDVQPFAKFVVKQMKQPHGTSGGKPPPETTRIMNMGLVDVAV